MKVTSIKVRKKSPIKSGIYTVEVKYTTGMHENAKHTDVFEWNLMEDEGDFPEDINPFRREQLEDVAKAYFTLMFYGFIEKSDEE